MKRIQKVHRLKTAVCTFLCCLSGLGLNIHAAQCCSKHISSQDDLGRLGNTEGRAELSIINGAEPETLDPALMTYQLDQRIGYALFEGLEIYNAKGQIRPGVAESYEVSKDGLECTFHIRKNAYWSNGKQITAQDVVNSWHRTLNPETAAEYAYLLYYLKNAQQFNEGKIQDFDQVGVHATDPFTLKVNLENPTPFFVALTASTPYCLVPTETIKQWGDSWTRPEHIVTNGAFLLTAWKVNDKIRLTKNPHYWNAAEVKAKHIDVLPINRPNTALNFFFGGLADLILDKGLTSPSLTSTLTQMPVFHSAPFLGNFFLRFNCTRPPFNDPRVRKAFCLVINKKAITTKITQAGELVANSFVPPGTGGYTPPPTDLEYNPQRARALLAEAGYPEGKGFPTFSYLYNDSELNEAIGIELQGMFSRELGVWMGLRRQELKVYIRSMHNLDYDIGRSTWIGDYNDPNTFLDLWVTDGGNNYTGWSNSTYNQLIAAAAKEMDLIKRFEYFKNAEQILVSQEAPICPLYFFVGIQLFDPKQIGGVEANLLDEHPFREMYRKAPPQ